MSSRSHIKVWRNEINIAKVGEFLPYMSKNLCKT